MKCEEREVICRDGRAALLRSAHPDDAAEMVRFLLDVCGETEFLLAYPEERQSLTDEGERTFLTRLTADDNELMLTAWVDGQLAGVANINFSTRLKMRHRANVAISIRRAYWRLGLGTAMLTELVDVAKAHPEVRRAQALYEKVGFRVVGVHPDAFVLKDGAMKKAYLMQLKIR